MEHETMSQFFSHTSDLLPQTRPSKNDIVSPWGSFQDISYFQGVNSPFGKMAGIEAAISSIIASKCSLYLLLKLALKWVFEKHFSVIIPIFFLVGK